MQTEFVRSLNCNYERILLDQKPDDKKYQYCMVSRGGIKGLLACELRYINGDAYLYYDISSRQHIRQLYSTKCIDRAWIKDFFWSLHRMRQELERFLLDTCNILMFPEQIYQDLENNDFAFLYVPYYEGESGFAQLMDFWIERIDYDVELLVSVVYHMYDQLEKKGDVYLQSHIFEDVKQLEEKEDNTAKEAKVEINAQEDIAETEEGPIKSAEKDSQAEPVLRKKKNFRLFEGLKKKEKDYREDYRQSMMEVMEGYAVAEDTAYEEEYGRTVFVEEAKLKDPQKKLKTMDGKVAAVVDKEELTLGKKKGEADVVLEDASVSRLHAKIEKEGETFYIEDLNSTNGTFKNGLRLQPYERRELEPGDEIKLGRVVLIFG